MSKVPLTPTQYELLQQAHQGIPVKITSSADSVYLYRKNLLFQNGIITPDGEALLSDCLEDIKRKKTDQRRYLISTILSVIAIGISIIALLIAKA